ncbi:OmpP1/FadL family transporter [Nereida sp. NH-UV-3]|uniref:OmpP1/FadL family transporter n=1 Tax=Nereida TaxID=282198 RepID=UPI0036F349DF
MNKLTTAGAVLLATTSLAAAGGIDRSNQFIGPLFEAGGETGSYVQLSIGKVDPTTTFSAGASSADTILPTYISSSFAIKSDLSEKLSFGVIVDAPFGVEVDYTGTALDAAPGVSPAPQADLSTQAITGLLRYKINENFSVHAGIRGLSVDGHVINDQGILTASNDRNWGYVAGVAYERSDIAMRIAITYNGEIDNDMAGTLVTPQNLTGAIDNFNVTTPESINVEFQTGIAADTLLFGTMRYAKYDGFNLTTTEGVNFVTFTNDTLDYSVGLGRQLSEKYSVAATYSKGEAGARPGTTPLAPTNGSDTIGLAATYTEGNMKLTAGVSYGKLGDQDVGAFQYRDASVVGFGLRLGYNF